MEETKLPAFSYYLDESDPDILILRRQDDTFVAAFSASSSLQRQRRYQREHPRDRPGGLPSLGMGILALSWRSGPRSCGRGVAGGNIRIEGYPCDRYARVSGSRF
jgi:hypothetical protein